jgi:hypothetical protein
MTLEKIPAGYEHLFNTGDRVNQMQGKEVETIIYEVCEKDRELHQGRKWALFETRSLNRKDHDETNNNKSETRISNWSTGMTAAQIVCLMAQAFAGGQGSAVAIGFSAGAQAFSSTGDRFKEHNNSKLDGFEHHYQRVGTMITDRSQMMNEMDRKHSESHQLATTVSDRIHRMFETTVSAS